MYFAISFCIHKLTGKFKMFMFVYNIISTALPVLMMENYLIEINYRKNDIYQKSIKKYFKFLLVFEIFRKNY